MIKTHDSTSESLEAKKKQAIRDERVSYLQVYSTALKLVNALAIMKAIA